MCCISLHSLSLSSFTLSLSRKRRETVTQKGMEVGTTGIDAALGEVSQEGDSEVASWPIVDDETASELSKLLDLFATPPPPIKVRFIDNPYSSMVIFQSSSAYITINGNEESCGSSFSDSDSSVMASIDVGGAWRPGSAWQFDRAVVSDWLMEGRVRDADVDVEDDGFLTEGWDCRGAAEDAMWMEFIGEIFE